MIVEEKRKEQEAIKGGSESQTNKKVISKPF